MASSNPQKGNGLCRQRCPWTVRWLPTLGTVSKCPHTGRPTAGALGHTQHPTSGQLKQKRAFARTPVSQRARCGSPRARLVLKSPQREPEKPGGTGGSDCPPSWRLCAFHSQCPHRKPFPGPMSGGSPGHHAHAHHWAHHSAPGTRVPDVSEKSPSVTNGDPQGRPLAAPLVLPEPRKPRAACQGLRRRAEGATTAGRSVPASHTRPGFPAHSGPPQPWRVEECRWPIQECTGSSLGSARGPCACDPAQDRDRAPVPPGPCGRAHGVSPETRGPLAATLSGAQGTLWREGTGPPEPGQLPKTQRFRQLPEGLPCLLAINVTSKGSQRKGAKTKFRLTSTRH